jgi:hypothetical protein
MSKDEKKKKKPGFMQRLFSSKKLSLDEEQSKESKDNKKKLQRMQTVDNASLSRDHETDKKVASKDDSAVNCKTSSKAGGSSTKPAAAKARPNGTAKPKQKRDDTGRAKRKKKKKSREKIEVDVSKGLTFPCTPEIILEYHKRKPFLGHNEEWLMVELNEFECLVDSMKIVKIIAKHSKFFEVEPDELWEEFFEWVDDIPAYDEVINYDIWQEFRDKKYPM